MSNLDTEINYVINYKCKNCQDYTFCKMPEMVRKIEKKDIKILNYISRCLFYKKKAV